MVRQLESFLKADGKGNIVRTTRVSYQGSIHFIEDMLPGIHISDLLQSDPFHYLQIDPIRFGGFKLNSTPRFGG